MNKDKNYKLVKEYPSSPKLGYIISPKVGDGEYKYYWGGNWFDPAEHPEFWEEVIEAPKYIKLLDSTYLRESMWYRIVDMIYEVETWDNMSVWVKCNVDIKNNDGEWKAGQSLCMDALYHHPEYYVEVTEEDYKKQKEEYEAQFIPNYVGVYFKHTSDEMCYIIRELDSKSYLIYWEKDTIPWDKENAHKLFKDGAWIKITKDAYDRYWKLGKYVKPLFTTHDGVNIYKGDPFYAYDTARNKILTYGGEPFVADKETPYPPVSHELYFSTLDAIEKYKKEPTVFTNCVSYVNTPVTYTLEEIGEVIEKKIGWGILWRNIIKPALIEFKK